MAHVGERVHPDPALEPREHLGDVGRTATVHPDRHRGDALLQERQRVAAVVLGQLGVRVHVDEAGRDHQPVDVHDHGGIEAGCRRVPDEADPLPCHADVPPDRRLSRAVVDETADQQQVRDRLGANVADPEHRHRQGGHERSVPSACVALGLDEHDGILPIRARGVYQDRLDLSIRRSPSAPQPIVDPSRFHRRPVHRRRTVALLRELPGCPRGRCGDFYAYR